MTAAVVVLAVALAGAIAALVAFGASLRQAARDVAAADAEALMAHRQALDAEVLRDEAITAGVKAEADRLLALSYAATLQQAAGEAREELIRAVRTQAAAADPGALAALVDELLGQRFTAELPGLPDDAEAAGAGDGDGRADEVRAADAAGADRARTEPDAPGELPRGA